MIKRNHRFTMCVVMVGLFAFASAGYAGTYLYEDAEGGEIRDKNTEPQSARRKAEMIKKDVDERPVAREMAARVKIDTENKPSSRSQIVSPQSQ